MGMGMDLDLELDLDQEPVKQTIRTINGTASGRAGVIQNGVGLVETCKSEPRSLIQPTSASRCMVAAKYLRPNTTGAHHPALHTKQTD